MKPLIRRERADRDVLDAVEYYQEGTPDVALALVDAIERACRYIQRRSATGSLRYAHELDLPGLRFWPCRRFPYLVFSMEHVDRIDIWRVLHASRDIPSWLREEQ